jgi:hypothetical protein
MQTSRTLSCCDARLHTLPDAPTLRTATHEQRVAHHERLRSQNANAIQPRFGTKADDDDGFFESACHGILEQEDYWRQCNLVWTWIDEEPVWLSPVDWDLEILPSPDAPTQRRFRFSLLGGGQITVIEYFKVWDLLPDPPARTFCFRTDLRVTADIGGSLQRFAGAIDGICHEMGAKAVLFRSGAADYRRSRSRYVSPFDLR